MDTLIRRLVTMGFAAALLLASPLRADELGDVTQDLLDVGMSPDTVETLFSGPDDTLGQRAQDMLHNGTITQGQYDRLNSRFLSLPEEKRRLLKNGYSKGYAGKVYDRMAGTEPRRLKEAGERKYNTRYEENGKENFEKYDLNHDGVIDAAEAKQSPEANLPGARKRWEMAGGKDGMTLEEARLQREREEAKYGDLRREHLDRYARTHPEFAEKWRNMPEARKEHYLRKAREHKRQAWERVREMPPERRRAFIQEGRRHRTELKHMTREKRHAYREAHPEHFRDRRENVRDRREDRRDRREDVRDRKEDRWDRREDVRDAKHDGGRKDRIEDRRDRREDVRDRKEDRRDRREDVRDRKEKPRGRDGAKPNRGDGRAGKGGKGSKGGKGRGRR